jgi:hypothetical protein
MTLAELKERVSAATGPDRELDIAIALAFSRAPEGYTRAVQHGTPMLWFWHEADHRAPYWRTPEYTASLDAVMALVSAKLPGWTWGIDTHSPDKGVCAILSKPTGECFDMPGDVVVEYAKTAPLAILAALLDAVEVANA